MMGIRGRQPLAPGLRALRLALLADQEKHNEKSRQNYAEENDEECSEIHQGKVTVVGCYN